MIVKKERKIELNFLCLASGARTFGCFASCRAIFHRGFAEFLRFERVFVVIQWQVG
jgi:hypothetical protein